MIALSSMVLVALLAAPEEPKEVAKAPGPLYCAQAECKWPRPLPERARFVVVNLHEEVTLGMASHVERVVGTLQAGDILVLDVNTFGGRVDAAVKIRDALLAAAEREGIWTVAYVHPRAISAGALISLATDVIVVAKGASIGAATPVQAGEGGEMKPVEEKVVSYMRSEMRATAQAKGRSGDIAEAMVDADVVFAGLIEKGKLLTLDGDQALAWGVASFQAQSLEALIAKFAYTAETHSVDHVEWNWAEDLAGWLSSPALSGILMSVGMLALMIGLYTGGSPIPLSIGVSALALFFFGHNVVDLVGTEEVLLLVAGLVLLGIEIYVPGFGVPGVLGILSIIGALVFALIDLEHVPFDVQWELGNVGRAITSVAAAILGAAVLAVLIVRRLPPSSLGKWLSLKGAVTARATDAVADHQEALIGRTASTVSELRPSGTVALDGKRHDAVAEHGFIANGQTVEIVGRRGFSLVVRAKEEGEPS